MTMHVLSLGIPQGGEWLIIILIALLLFGRRLPEVGRSLGQGLVEFKKGLRGVDTEVSDIKKQIDSEVEGAKKQIGSTGENKPRAG